jgi:hypothetical protein
MIYTGWGSVFLLPAIRLHRSFILSFPFIFQSFISFFPWFQVAYLLLVVLSSHSLPFLIIIFLILSAP